MTTEALEEQRRIEAAHAATEASIALHKTISDFQKLPGHIQRVLEECGELKDRMDKLRAFIDGIFFKTLHEAQRELLVKQLAIMASYASILEQRIALF